MNQSPVGMNVSRSVRARVLGVFLTVGMLSTFAVPTTRAAEYSDPIRSDWFYLVNAGGQPVCYADELTAATTFINTPPGACQNTFDHWNNAWPNADNQTTLYSTHSSCLPPGVTNPPGHVENRGYTWRRYSGSPCTEWVGTWTAGASRQFVWYCPAGFTLETPQAGGTTSPTPVCRLNSDQPHPRKQPRSNDCCNFGNPINIALGQKLEREIDYVGYGAFPLSMERYYSGSWRHTYERSITVEQLINTANFKFSTVVIAREDGRGAPFTVKQGIVQTPDPDVVERLETVFSSGVQIGWRVRDSNDAIEVYALDGKLLSITNRAGLTHTLAYDTAGKLSTVTDSHGRQLVFGYNANARLSTVTDPAGGIYQYGYNPSGLLSTVTYPDLNVRTYLYGEPAYTSGANLPNALTGILDENNHRFATFTYDASGRAIQSEHAGGAGAVTVAYNADGSRSVTDAVNATRTITLIVKNNVSKIATVSGPPCSNCGLAASYAYNANGSLSDRYDFRGVRRSYQYSTDGRSLETAHWDAKGTALEQSTSTTWHPTLRVPMQIIRGYRQTTFTRDASGNVLTRRVMSLQSPYPTRTWTYTYNSVGQVLTEDGPRTDVSDVTTYTYYSCVTGYECGQLNTITNAVGQITTFNTYDAHGQPLTIADPNGIVTTLTYDARRRITSRQVGSETTTFAYWPTGLLKKSTLPDGSYLLNTYDDAHRLTRIEDGEGNRIDYTLDAMGNRTAESAYDPTNGLARTRSQVFNASNQLWKQIGAAGTAAVTTEFGNDNNGNLTTIDAPLSRNTTNQYDELNRLTQITDPASGVTKFGYDINDNLNSVIDPRNRTTSYTYDGFGDLKQAQSPDTGTNVNTFDSGGNLATSKDARNKTGTYAYDALNRVTGLTYPDQTISYTYDSGTNQKGRLTQVSDASGSTSWSYDTHGRVLTRQQSMGITKSLGYAYDSDGRLQTLTLPSGNTITYGYTDGKITSLVLNGSTTILSNVLYQPFGPTRGWTWGNSTLAIREYDADGKVTDIDSAGLKTYSYDDAFRITGITDAANSSLSQSYGYDLLDRITSATGTSLSQGWTYDANGNRLTQTGSTASTFTVSSTSNRLSSVSGALTRTYGYDNSGNTTGDGTVTFTYNDAGRMVSATKASVTTTYALNALGQRVKKITSGLSTYFVHDESGHLIGEYNNSGSLIQETVWFGDTPVATLRPNGSGVDLFYVHTDHLDTPRRISRPSDNVVVWRWDSDPFGTTTASQDPDGDSNVFTYSLRFLGQYFDAESGLHYNYFRDYDPETGRYVESDLVGLNDGTNTYAYVANDPNSGVDPLGLSAFKIIKLCANGYKVVKTVGFKRAVQALRRGEDVLASSTKQARKVAKAAGRKGKATRDAPHKDGYMPHHHPKPRTGGHVFRDMAAGMTIADHVECESCVPAYLAEIGDFLNPLSVPNDLIEIYDVIEGED